MPTRKMIKALIAIGITTVLLLSASSFKLYYVRDDSGGQLLWNADEGYLFMSVARRTFKFSYLEYPWIAFKEWVNVPPIPKDERVFLTVIRVTQSGIERHVGKAVGSTGSIPDLFTPIGAQFMQIVRELSASGPEIISRMQRSKKKKNWTASIILFRTSILR
ncbi:MAG: hypothetical protein DMG97_24165 [Acidobacteria bacterium]|nr:MAG: hypothetical protein DMG97_24165 [Acidobacteriota bacterium]